MTGSKKSRSSDNKDPTESTEADGGSSSRMVSPGGSTGIEIGNDDYDQPWQQTPPSHPPSRWRTGSTRDSARRQSIVMSSATMAKQKKINTGRSTKKVARSRSAVGLRHGLSNLHDDDGDSEEATRAQLMRQVEENSFSPMQQVLRRVSRIKGQEKTSVELIEANARKKADSSLLHIAFLNMAAAIVVFLRYLIKPTAIFTSTLSAGLTLYWYRILIESDGQSSFSMDKILLTFAVITPMSASVIMSFNRREQALMQIARFRSFAFQIYLSQSVWDWLKKDGGKAESNYKCWTSHADEVMQELVGMGDDMSRFLTLPTSSSGWHRFTKVGRDEAVATMSVAYRLFDSMCTQRMTRIGLLTEELKEAGLSTSEASRMRSYERSLCDACENLRVLKSYRTPVALRSFVALFLMFVPPLYAPSYAQLAYNLNSLAYGIAFAIITSVSLAALFEAIEVLEDPFVGFSALDGIDVVEEFTVLHWQQLVNAREIIYPEAANFPAEQPKAIAASLDNVRFDAAPVA